MKRLDGQPPAKPGSGERAAYAHAYYLKHKKRYKKYRLEQRERRKEISLLRLYGIGSEQFTMLIQAQGNACAICHVAFDLGHKDTQAHVDHRHEDGKPGRAGTVRGLLCNKCNKGLGHFKDNPEFLTAAIAYLAAPPAFAVLGVPAEQPRLFLLDGEVA